MKRKILDSASFDLSPLPLGTWILLAILPALLLGCDLAGGDGTEENYEFDFTESDHEWEAFFTGYPVGWDEKMELTSDYRSLPESVDSTRKALFISALNQSDDVKMLFRRQISGLQPNATYRARFSVRFATSAPSDCPGVGGPPGESVRVIAAATNRKPEPMIVEKPDDYYVLNVQHQNDPQEWYEDAILGNIANSRDCEEEEVFEMKELTSEDGHDTVTADENGEAWLLFGTRSGFEGETRLYYTSFRAELRR